MYESEEINEFIRRMPYLAGCPERIRDLLIEEIALAEEVEGRALADLLILVPVTTILSKLLEEFFAGFIGEAGEDAWRKGKEIFLAKYREIKERFKGLLTPEQEKDLPTEEEVKRIFNLITPRPAPQPSPKAIRISTLDYLIARSKEFRVKVMQRFGKLDLNRLIFLAETAYLKPEELLSLKDSLGEIAKRKFGVEVRDFELNFSLEKFIKAKSRSLGKGKEEVLSSEVHLLPFSDPVMGAFILYDPERIEDYPNLRDLLIAKPQRLIAMISHEYLGHGFIYRNTKMGEQVTRARLEEMRFEGGSLEAMIMHDKYRALMRSLIVVDEGFAFWLELKMLDSLKSILGNDIIRDEMVRYFYPEEDPYRRAEGDYFKRYYGKERINPYKEGYRIIMEIEKHKGERGVIKAVIDACNVQDLRAEKLSLSELKSLLLEHRELCPDQRLKDIFLEVTRGR